MFISVHVVVYTVAVGQIEAVGTRPNYQGKKVSFNRKKTLHQPAGPNVAPAASKAAHCRIVMAKWPKAQGQPTLR